jgi:opacity protein-like surface antigen
MTSKPFRLRGLVLTVLLAAALPGAMRADDDGGLLDFSKPHWYSGIYLGGNAGGEVRQRAAESSTTWADWEPGEMGGLQLGYKICPLFRVEVEGAAFHNHASVLSPTPTTLTSESAYGAAFLRAVMFNGYFDYPIKNTKLSLYAGGGAGMLKSYLDGLSNPSFQAAGVEFSGPSDGETFAWQARGGLTYHFSRNWEAYSGFRFFDGQTLNFYLPTPFGQFHAAPKETAIYGAEVGFRFTFW